MHPQCMPDLMKHWCRPPAGVGVGKTMMAGSVLESVPQNYSNMTINFSAQTSSNSLQDTIEGKLEKRTKVTTSSRYPHPTDLRQRWF